MAKHRRKIAHVKALCTLSIQYMPCTSFSCNKTRHLLARRFTSNHYSGTATSQGGREACAQSPFVIIFWSENHRLGR